MVEVKKDTWKKFIINVLLLLVTSEIVFYFIEVMYFQSFSRGLSFIFNDAKIAIRILNFCIIFIFELFIFSLSKNIAISFEVTSLIVCILVIVNELKMGTRGEAFTFNDISVAKEAFMVAGNYNLKLNSVDVKVIVLICFLSIMLSIFAFSKNSITNKSRKKICISALVCGVIFLIFFSLWMNIGGIIKYLGGENYIFVNSVYYDEYGYLLGLARTTPHSFRAPEGYSKEKLSLIKEEIVPKGSNNTPNVIFVMNESLYDIAQLEGIKFNKDPLEKMKEWKKEYTFGDFISPAYGGATCNVEFEVITGCALKNINRSGTMPYSDMIHNDISSLVSMMNQDGYYTTAFHPNTGTFFNRRNIYNYMGFDEINFIEEMGNFSREGIYASDLELYKKVIESYENNKINEMPFFSYVITMQNHGGYNYDYNDCGIKVIDGGRCGNEKTLETYANIICSSVDAFEDFITYFEGVEEPTVIVMFGDHSPGLEGFEYEFNGENIGELKYRTTPLIVYSNYELPYEDWGYVNGYNLASKVLNYCGINMDEFFTYATEENNVPTVRNLCYVNNEWIKLDSAEPEIKDYKQKLWLMAYDRLFGKGYGDWNNG